MKQVMRPVQSWGRLAAPEHSLSVPAFLDEAVSAFDEAAGPILAFGKGRSYGDVCFNSSNCLLDTYALDRLIAFDRTSGVIRAEAGLTFDALLCLAVPHGWFLPVTPGTKFVTLGGAIANDVHGKNHESAGTLGCYVRRLALARSGGEILELGPDDSSGLFAATIGGLGLTGVILWAELALKRIDSAFLDVETLALANLDEFFRLSESSRDWEYTVAWVDCLAKGSDIGRGLFMRGRHREKGPLTPHGAPRLSIPLDAPGMLLNGETVRLFNFLYRSRPWAIGKRIQHYDAFFYPLDAIGGWNRLYGSRGLYQHQCVIPTDAAPDTLRRLLSMTAERGEGSFLIVLKMFGDRASPGLLSFPSQGATLALDFPNRGESTRRLVEAMNETVIAAGGRIYPAKDATMSRAAFQNGYPNWRKLEDMRDKKVMSDFWRRVSE